MPADLFDGYYPTSAGSKGGGASELAASKITRSGRKRVLENQVLALFEIRPDWTPDGAAVALGLHPADIRPRFSELCAEKVTASGVVVRPALLLKTKETRLSGRGNSQHVYIRRAVFIAS